MSQHAPGLRVCLIDAGRGGRVGDTVPPLIAPILRHLGVWDSFFAGGHRPAYRSASAWGRLPIGTNEYLFLGAGPAWQLDRATFDRSLVEAAIPRVARFDADLIVGCKETDDGLAISMKTGATLSARYAIDATGRTAALSRMLGAPRLTFDRLIGCVAYTQDNRIDRNELVLESFASGWWYTAGLPHGRRIVACMTDANQIRSLGLASPDSYRLLLAGTRHVGTLQDHDAPLEGPHIHPANSRRTVISASVPLLPAGDAAFAVDPICGQGIVNALRSGIYAAYAVADWLRASDERGLGRYRAWIDAACAAYRVALRDFYATEARWPDHSFWRRRHGMLSSVYGGPQAG
jgi:flavin-dependent dehydrogenase